MRAQTKTTTLTIHVGRRAGFKSAGNKSFWLHIKQQEKAKPCSTLKEKPADNRPNGVPWHARWRTPD